MREGDFRNEHLDILFRIVRAITAHEASFYRLNAATISGLLRKHILSNRDIHQIFDPICQLLRNSDGSQQQALLELVLGQVGVARIAQKIDQNELLDFDINQFTTLVLVFHIFVQENSLTPLQV